jgi:MerR family transcriptional regulator, copper efflux regulator
LLPTSDRTTSGYRIYDDHTLERLSFIARAKTLGCTLEEISDLITAWQGGQCGPVQDRLQAVVVNRLEQTRHQIAELATFSDELDAAARMLRSHRPSGPCDEQCGCIATPSKVATDAQPSGTTARTSQTISLISKPATNTHAAPIACTLGSADLVMQRLDEWTALLGYVSQREHIDNGVRATFGPGAPLDELIRLTAAEQSCCEFFTFAITVDSRGIALETRGPVDSLPILYSLFGEPS